MPASDIGLAANFTPTLVSSITIPEGDQSKIVGDADFTLTVTVTPDTALNQTVDWASTDETVATVTSGGVVSIVAAGTADISATSTDGSNVSDVVTVTVTDAPGTLTLYEAYAFGEDSYTRETPNQSGKDYVKVVQDGTNFTYSESQGHGYTDLDKLDGSPNDRNSSACGEELYDQFIGVKNGPGDIKFRVDVPNGDYQFVAAMGDASYSHYNIMKVRDGSDGTLQTLISGIQCAKDEYAIVEFDDKVVPACSGATFTAQPESPVLTVTNGYIEVIQESTGNGGDLVLCEIWSLDGHIKSAATKQLGTESLAATVKLYPNPSEAGQALNIELIGFEYETNATINIMDVSGRIAYSTSVKTHGHASQRVGISTEGLSSGMYMVVVRSDNKVINQRLIIR
jgi:hypothetical protein